MEHALDEPVHVSPQEVKAILVTFDPNFLTRNLLLHGEQMVREYFEEKAEVEQVKRVDDFTFQVYFHNHQDALSQLNKDHALVGYCRLSVFLYDEQSRSVYSGPEVQHVSMQGKGSPESPPSTVLVTSLYNWNSDLNVKTIFESEENRAGPVKSVKYMSEDRIAFVQFEKFEDALKIVSMTQVTVRCSKPRRVNVFLYRGAVPDNGLGSTDQEVCAKDETERASDGIGPGLCAVRARQNERGGIESQFKQQLKKMDIEQLNTRLAQLHAAGRGKQLEQNGLTDTNKFKVSGNVHTPASLDPDTARLQEVLQAPDDAELSRWCKNSSSNSIVTGRSCEMIWKRASPQMMSLSPEILDSLKQQQMEASPSLRPTSVGSGFLSPHRLSPLQIPSLSETPVSQVAQTHGQTLTTEAETQTASFYPCPEARLQLLETSLLTRMSQMEASLNARLQNEITRVENRLENILRASLEFEVTEPQAALRMELSNLRCQSRSSLVQVQTIFRADLNRLQSEFGQLKSDVDHQQQYLMSENSAVRSDVNSLQTQLRSELRQYQATELAHHHESVNTLEAQTLSLLQRQKAENVIMKGDLQGLRAEMTNLKTHLACRYGVQLPSRHEDQLHTAGQTEGAGPSAPLTVSNPSSESATGGSSSSDSKSTGAVMSDDS